MAGQPVVDSMNAMVQEYIDADSQGKALAMREMSGYVRALLDLGQWDAASHVGGIVTTLIEYEQR